MRRRKRDITLTLALCLSLVVHAWIVRAAAVRYVRDNARLILPGLAPPPVPQIAILPPRDKREEPPPPPPIVEREDRLGESDPSLAKGDATAATPGVAPLRAPKASQAQADLSLDPAGMGGSSSGAPSPPGANQPSPATPPPSASRIMDAAEDAAPLRLPESPRPETDQIAIGEKRDDRDQQREPLTETTEPTVERQAVAKAETPAPPTAAPATPRAASAVPGDPSPQADSESDAFTTTATVDFSSGKTVARLGRKHKLFRPKLEMAGLADLYQLRAPVTVVLKLHLDATGNVTKAEIVKSSGSINVDQPTLIAAYKWWFEPSSDPAAKGKSEVIVFTCRFV